MAYYRQPTYQEGWGRAPPAFLQQPAQLSFQPQPPSQNPLYYSSGYRPHSFDLYAQDVQAGTNDLLGSPESPDTRDQYRSHSFASRVEPSMVVIPRFRPPSPLGMRLSTVMEERSSYLYSSRSHSRSRSRSPPPVHYRHQRPRRSGHKRHRRGRSPDREYGGYSSRRSMSRPPSRSYTPESYGLTRDRSPVRVSSVPFVTRPLQLAGDGRLRITLKQEDDPQRLRMVPPEWMMHPDSTSPPYQFNPLLVGNARQETLIAVDLRVSSLTFEPKRLTSAGATIGQAIHPEELSQPATYPGVTEMTITCDEIPQWKIDLKLSTNPSSSPIYSVEETRRKTPSLTVYDVLFGIQHSIRTHISHDDWAALSEEQRDAIADAYKRRCRANPGTMVFEESQGVRRVDYLLDKHFFKGLVLPMGPEQFKNVKLIVGKK